MSFSRGFPTAHCAHCEADQLVWRDPGTNAPRCLACDTELSEAAVERGAAGDIVDRNDYVFLDVTESAEACGCDTCPAQGKCHHTQDHDHEATT
jgi:hypothetical protein